MDPRGQALIVIDASFALALVLPDEQRPASTSDVVAARLGTAHIWPLELANAMRANLRRGRLTLPAIEGAFQRLAALQVDVVASPHATPRRHFESAVQHELTPYDATYLELALFWSCPLATRDQALQHAAQRAGLRVLN